MNQLLRGAEKSKCFLRVGRQAFSTSESALAVGAQNLTQLTWQAEPANRGSYPFMSTATPLGSSCTHRLLSNDRFVLNRNLSSLSADTDTDTDGQEQSSTAIQRTPSVLDKANLEEVTPGHAIFVLQKSAAKGKGQMIRQSDFVQLCESSRPGKLRDAKVIATALKEFKRNNRFVLQMEGSRAAVEGMMRSMTPTWKVQDGKPRVRAALFVAEQILDETTGLYFATETVTVDKVLEELRTGLLEMEENGFNLKIDNVGDVAEDVAEGEAETEAETKEEPSAEEKLLRDALRLTEGVVKLLMKRKSRPEWGMKKRAKRKYLKMLQISGGPYGSTMSLATQISIFIGGSAVAKKNIVRPFADFSHPHHKQTNASRQFKMIKEARAKESGRQKSAEAATAAEEGGGEEAEKDESNADDGDEEEGDSQTEPEEEVEKKD
mmetsp:Transcript_16670/g.36041  ORF Transcript_16670/g.36041 Transcript_16670/m.36041 type:complete len:435 (-) Transcript_16670:199-1503(-)|eukprot:CAMPEP_0172318856 /NCGR_PEP_ID=MMETSP1058-20130122/36041_1 /TAXON_ID=83371 /ORGANISM="Detonula confervacea, Strain CCMP 353" /LENGTH=434 /DNA_ID=CAMNT_0013033777 /DNA_START=34 /DNA_END=1338 /DNA_ORIENTATION=+